jgi:HSP20 family protein
LATGGTDGITVVVFTNATMGTGITAIVTTIMQKRKTMYGIRHTGCSNSSISFTSTNKNNIVMYNRQSCGTGHGFYGCGPMHGSGGWGGPWRRHMEQRFGGGFRRVPVNIEETDDSFELSLFAPALIKEHIKISVKDDVLTVAYSAPEQQEETSGNYKRREYSNGSFERTFMLNGKVLTGNISAAYTDGILKLSLPKNPDTNKPAQDISIS